MTGDSRRIACTRAKSNAHYICQECNSTELIQAHHEIPKDDNSIVVLCANCHSKRHPRIPRAIFFKRNHQPYWENISASSLARELGKHPRTIWRVAQKFNIPKGILSDEAKAKIQEVVLHPYPKTSKTRGTGRGYYLTTKWIKGHPYLYKVCSERNGNKIRQIFIKYLGRADKLNKAKIEEKLA